MYILSEGKLYKKEQIELKPHKKQIVFTTIDNQKIIDWLESDNFPESFIEDIKNDDQSVAYEENERFKLIILKFFKESTESALLYNESNVAIVMHEQKLIFLAREKSIIKSVVNRLFKRYKPNDSLEYVLYLIIDILVDNSMSVIDFIDNSLEEIEDKIFNESLDEQEIQKRLYFARRTLNRVAKLSIQQNDIINKIFNHFPVVMRKRLKYEFIDLKEHLSFLINESKSYLDRTGYLQNLLMGFLSNRMNQAMQRLAAISLIFLPLTFIVGNYGMNFKNMPEIGWEFGYMTVWITNIVIALLIYKWLKKRRWI